MPAQKSRRATARTTKNRRDPTPPARRLRAMYNHLVERFGPQQWWPAKTPFEVVIGAYLTQNTAWKSVERSIANLEARGVLSIDGLRAIPEPDLRDLIRPSGFMLRKAAALKAFVAFLDTHHSGQMDALRHAALDNPHTVRDQLLALLSVGPETADAILLYALDAPAMVVDEYLRRIVTRHNLAPEKAKYAEIQSLAEQAFAPDRAADNPADLARHYNEFHALIVQIGKSHCGRVARCEGCPLQWDPHKNPSPA
jgi:endonuclease-3 related protein